MQPSRPLCLLLLLVAYRRSSKQPSRPRTCADTVIKQTIRNLDVTARIINDALAKQRGQDNTKNLMGQVTAELTSPPILIEDPDRSDLAHMARHRVIVHCAPNSRLPQDFRASHLPSNTDDIHSLRFERIAGIEDNAFKGLKNIEKIFTDENLRRIGKRTFANCHNLKKVVLHEGLTHIDDHAFADCVELTEIHIPSTVVSIGDGAFANCYNLQKVYVPDNPQALHPQISPTAFTGCTNLHQEIQYTYEKGICTIC